MGEGPISWRDLEAWSSQIGVELEPWEARLLVALSGDYVAERYRARKPDCPPPWNEFEEKPETARDRVTGQFAAMFRALARK